MSEKQCECGKMFKPGIRGHRLTNCKNCVTNRRRFELKLKCINYLGGKCKICGYDRCPAGLDFDHIDASTKEFRISGKHCLSWERIRKELDKCQLLCANCHREKHWYENDKRLTSFAKFEYYHNKICSCCGKEFYELKSSDKKFCSPECRLKIKWPSVKEVLNRLSNSNFEKLSRELGVSSNAIRKFLKRNGIDPKRV